MFQLNDDKSIYVTRGDIGHFAVTAVDDGEKYIFKAGDLVRIKVYGKKDASSVVLQKDFPVIEEAESVDIILTEKDTKIGEVISKPKDYWYEVELNPLSDPQTIIGYDEDGAKVFRVFPEGRDLTENDPVITPEDIPIVDDKLDLTSKRPVENHVIARAVAQINGTIKSNDKKVAEQINHITEDAADIRAKTSADASAIRTEIAVERARIDAFTSLEDGSTTGDAELIDSRIDAHGVQWSNAGNGMRGFTGYLESRLDNISSTETEDIAYTLESGYYNSNGVLTSHNDHKHIKIAVSGGETFFVSTYYGYVVPDALVLDGNGEFIQCYHTYAESFKTSNYDEIIVIPKGAATLVVNICANHSLGVRRVTEWGLKYDKIDSYTKNLAESLKGGNENLSGNLCAEYTAKTLIPESGEVKAYDDEKFVTTEVAVNPGERYRIVYGHNYTNYGYIFLNSKNEVVSASNIADGTSTIIAVNEVVVVPFGAVKLVLAHITTSGYPCAFKIEGYTDKKWSNKKWACVGDSLTEENNRTTEHYHDYVAKHTGIEVVNMGVSGSGYMRLYEEDKAFYQRISAIPIDADVITIFGSGNDLSHDLGNVTDTETDTVCGCINTTIDKLYSIMPIVQLGIITPTPWESYSPNNAENKMELYANAIVEICKRRGIPCLDLYHCSNLRPWDDSFKQLAYSKDDGNGVHPDETGHKLIAPRVKSFLESLLI